MICECPLEGCDELFETHRTRAQHIRRDHDASRPAADKATLHELYVVEGRSQAEIADYLDTRLGTVFDWTMEFDIPAQPPESMPTNDQSPGQEESGY